MRKIILSILLLVSLRLAVSSQEVKIVHLGAGHGDCTLIVIKDCANNSDCANTMKTITILIDASKIRGVRVLDAVEKILDPRGAGYRIDFFIVSHFDQDHYQGGTGLLKTLRERRDKAVKRSAELKRQADAESDPVKAAAAAKLLADTDWIDKMVIYDRKSFHDTPTTSDYPKWVLPESRVTPRPNKGDAVPNTWQAYVNSRTAFVVNKAQAPLLLVGKNILDSYGLKNVEMICIASNGVIGKKDNQRKLKTEVKALPLRNSADPLVKRHENDLSSAFLLRFGAFRYYTGGDLCGKEETEAGIEKYTDIETPLATWVKNRWVETYGTEDFHVCAAKLNHHGSNSSTNKTFKDEFNPRLAVISAGNVDFSSTGKVKKINPDEEPIVDLLGMNFPIPANKKRDRPVLFTFKFRTALDPTEKAYKKWLSDKRLAKPPGGDIILYVKKEDDGSPIMNGLPPQIQIFRRDRNRRTLVPLGAGNELPFKIREGQGAKGNIYFCDKGNAHKNLVLPAFGPDAPPTSPRP